MMNTCQTNNNVLSVEFFAAKDSSIVGGVFLAVPGDCGLRHSDTLRINGSSMTAERNAQLLPLSFPALTNGCREKLQRLSARGKQLPVAECVASGLVGAYFVNILVED